jgi:hypothetical protein
MRKNFGHWDAKTGAARKWFENFARSQNLDPLLASTWYSMNSLFVERKVFIYYLYIIIIFSNLF